MIFCELLYDVFERFFVVVGHEMQIWYVDVLIVRYFDGICEQFFVLDVLLSDLVVDDRNSCSQVFFFELQLPCILGCIYRFLCLQKMPISMAIILCYPFEVLVVLQRVVVCVDRFETASANLWVFGIFEQPWILLD